MSDTIRFFDHSERCTRSNKFKNEIFQAREKENLHVQEAPLSCKELAKKVLIIAGLAWISVSVAYNINAYLNEDNSECKEGFELGVKRVWMVLNNSIKEELSSLDFTGCIINGTNISLTHCFNVCKQYYEQKGKGS